jgi:hypothetical protein
MKFKTGYVASIGEVAQVRPDVVVASGRSDLCVRSAHTEQFLESNSSIFEGWL